MLYSVTSAIGAAIEDRSSRTGNRETIVMNYDEFTADAKRLENKRKDLHAHRAASIVEAAINAFLMRPVESSRRTPSTVGEASANCQHADQRTADACAEVTRLREELAVAKEESELDREIAKLKENARELRERGAVKSSDPQAELLASVTGGWLSPREVSRALALLLAMYLAERIEPAPRTETVSEGALYAGYAAWCRASDLAALSLAEFVAGFDRLRAENRLGKIRKRKDGYGGIRLTASP